MKQSALFIAFVFLFSISACGQSDKAVPASVTSAFAQKFPKASKIKWGKESDKEWEAEFVNDGKEYSANFDNSGIWTETEYEISVKEIPATVKATLDTESAGYKIDESSVSENKDGKAYEFVIVKGKTEMEMVINPAGKLLKKEQIKEEEDDDDKK